MSNKEKKKSEHNEDMLKRIFLLIAAFSFIWANIHEVGNTGGIFAFASIVLLVIAAFYYILTMLGPFKDSEFYKNNKEFLEYVVFGFVVLAIVYIIIALGYYLGIMTAINIVKTELHCNQNAIDSVTTELQCKPDTIDFVVTDGVITEAKCNPITKDANIEESCNPDRYRFSVALLIVPLLGFVSVILWIWWRGKKSKK